MGEKKIVKTTCKSCHGGCGVLVTVEDGVITHINTAGAKLFGFASSDDIIGKKMFSS